MSTPTDFLLWVRGPGFDIALVIFIIGVIIRLLEVLVLGRKPDQAEPRGGELGPGLRTVVTRTLPETGSFKRAPFTVIGGYIWHIGFFISLFLFVPHIELINATLGLIWPGIPSNLVDAVAAVTIVTLIAMLFSRLSHPVKRYLSGPEDYVTWLVTFLPMLTGYLAYHRMIDPYPLVLGLHILSVELLMVVFPFTKLMHAFTFIIARWYNGAMAGRRGVQS
ncbi:MAG: respiratory nitrate reductase subunit gamma [Candidatus Thiodiazotropha sp. (ex Myrtea spinifera)]|nr:respiratory nitrate reductase subunit gamma [Candidatus Thiodiazotropha sp. (ex Myrtea spinifera)]MCU7830995.1 respiratory nitrate reductase subunit gamma [Candidatus Thiodiazotropha sp. (ex Myrtea sp. 'scaly one' KF741663)]